MRHSEQSGFARADAALTKLWAALAENRTDDAIALGHEAVGAAPGYTRAISGLVSALQLAGRKAEVRRVLDSVPPKLSGSTAELVEMARLCLREGAHESAKQILLTALDTAPENTRVAEVLAEVHLSEHDFAAAAALCHSFRARGLATPLMLRLLASAYEQLNDLPAAIECARLYTREAPLDPRGHYHLASLEHRAGNVHAAMERYELALSLDGANEIAAAAVEGIRALDAVQLRRITALAAADSAFRIALARNPREAIEARGFILSDEGLALLMSLDPSTISRDAHGSGYSCH